MAFKPDYRLMQVKVLQNAPIEHSAILSTSIKLPFSIKRFVLYIVKWSPKAGFFTVSLLYAGNPCDLDYMFITNRNPFWPSQTEKEQ